MLRWTHAKVCGGTDMERGSVTQEISNNSGKKKNKLQ